jgi:hypothetical protein
MEQRSTRKFGVNLKKISIEMFEILKSAYSKECFPRTNLFE